MTNVLIGYTGLVGLNLQQFYKFDFLYNSKNFHEAKNKSFDTVFFLTVENDLRISEFENRIILNTKVSFR